MCYEDGEEEMSVETPLKTPAESLEKSIQEVKDMRDGKLRKKHGTNFTMK
ncbi:hypothetical protein [Gracilibacillus phocaeensis]|nr:hypothetical protein [Gracilibacillus phocaeensis]